MNGHCYLIPACINEASGGLDGGIRFIQYPYRRYQTLNPALEITNEQTSTAFVAEIVKML